MGQGNGASRDGPTWILDLDEVVSSRWISKSYVWQGQRLKTNDQKHNPLVKEYMKIKKTLSFKRICSLALNRISAYLQRKVHFIRKWAYSWKLKVKDQMGDRTSERFPLVGIVLYPSHFLVCLDYLPFMAPITIVTEHRNVRIRIMKSNFKTGATMESHEPIRLLGSKRRGIEDVSWKSLHRSLSTINFQCFLPLGKRTARWEEPVLCKCELLSVRKPRLVHSAATDWGSRLW